MKLDIVLTFRPVYLPKRNGTPVTNFDTRKVECRGVDAYLETVMGELFVVLENVDRHDEGFGRRKLVPLTNVNDMQPSAKPVAAPEPVAEEKRGPGRPKGS